MKGPRPPSSLSLLAFSGFFTILSCYGRKQIRGGFECDASCDFTQPNTSAKVAPRYSPFVSVIAGGEFCCLFGKDRFSVFLFFCPIPALIYGHFGGIMACFRVRNEERGAGPKEIPQIGNVFSRFPPQIFAPSRHSEVANSVACHGRLSLK